jgi:predicted amidohydrolase YtcJ
MVVPDWAQKSPAELERLLADPKQGPRLREAIGAALDRRDGGKSVRIARFSPKPGWVGRDLAAIARDEKLDPVDVVLAVQKEGGAQAISFGMSEEDVRYAMARPYVATASDGGAHAAGSGDKPHPRSYGTFPRKVRYALDDKVLTLEQAIHSATGLPASVLGLPDRGTLRVGAVADVVVFDPATFRDTATFDDPTRHATGVKALAVNGVLAIQDGAITGALAGRALRRHRDGPASRIIRAGSIRTGDPDRPRAQAIAIRDETIVAVGSDQDVAPFRGPATAVLDLPDAFIVPGLVDAHAHMSQLGASLEQVDLRGVASLEEVARKVRERIAATPGDGWILGANWDQSLWPGGAFPTSSALDAVAPDRPVWLSRVDGHAGWANSEALRRAGVTAETQPPADGQIIRGADGKPTGVFIDGAMGLVGRAVPAATREDLTRQILAAQSACLKVGLTGIHDAGLSPLEIEAYRQLDREGKLRLRIYGMASPPSGKEVEFVSQPPPGRIGDRFTVRAIKLFMDGAMGSRGALLFEPYRDDPHNRGLKLIDETVLRATTEQALRTGWQVCTHAIGDRGNAMVLDAYEKAQKAVPDAKDARLRVEHAQVVRRADVARFREGGIIASMQPSHASTDKRWADARLGAGSDRVAGAYAWGWFRDEKVALAFGSDFPVEVTSPFWGLYAAITRRDEDGQPPGGWHPEHLLTIEEALRHFTAGSARASFDEGRFGRIAPGFQADLTVIDRNLFRATPAEVLAARVVLTVIAGRDETPR